MTGLSHESLDSCRRACRVCVDTGPAPQPRRYRHSMGSGVASADVTVFLTHVHLDHASSRDR